MSQRVKRPNRSDDGSVPTKRRKRPTAEEEEAASLAAWHPRPLNDFKSIYNRSTTEAPAELFRKDLISAMKLPDSEPLASHEYWVIVDQWKQEWERGVQVPVNPDSLPEPSVTVTHCVGAFKPQNEFKLPKTKYIRITKDDRFNEEDHRLSNAPAQSEAACSYDLDECDVSWLKLVNEERTCAGLGPLSEDHLERVLERLELRCWDKIQSILRNEEGLGIEYDENVICDVCRSPDSEEGNEMVFCDSCNICVHQACYGITRIPEGQWLCCTCALSQRPDCVLCPNKGGAMKCTRSGKHWAHVSCALWIPEVSIGCVEKMEPITKISSIPTSRWALICVLCRERVGACIQCSVKTCKTAYHVTCAFKHGLEMRAIIEDENADDGVKLRSYCEKHSKSSKKEKSVCSGSEDDDSKRRKRKDMTSEEKNQARAARLQEIESEFYKHVSVKDIAVHVDIDSEALQYIYNYWKLKRKAGNNKPLLPPKSEDVDMLSHKQEQADLEKMKMFVQLRQDLERVRNLCYMVSRREKLSRSFFRMREQTFHKQVAVLASGCQTLTAPVIHAVIEANHGPSIYDRLYSHSDAEDHTNDIDEILARIAGVKSPQYEKKTEFNGVFKDLKNNPYKKLYFNGSSKRRSGSMYSGMSSAGSSDERPKDNKENRIHTSSEEEKPPTLNDKKKLAATTHKRSTGSKAAERRQKRLSVASKIKIESSSEEDVKEWGSLPKSRLKQMETELGISGSDSDELMPIRSSKPTDSQKVKAISSIYSDSDSDVSLRNDDKSSNAASDSQQSKLRTKAAVKEFSQKPSTSKSPNKSSPENKKKTKEDAKNVTVKKKDYVPSDLIVPQRQAAKKASENMKSTTTTRVKEQPQINEQEKPIIEEKPKVKTKKAAKDATPKEAKKETKVDVFDIEKEMDKAENQEILAYVPQREAAKKASEHIKSLGKPGMSETTNVDPNKNVEAAKLKNQPELKKKEVEEKPAKVTDSKRKSSSNSSSSSSSSSTDSSSSSSSESEDEPPKTQSESLFSSQSREPTKLSNAKDWPFLDKVTKSQASSSSSDTSDSSRSSTPTNTPTNIAKPKADSPPPKDVPVRKPPAKPARKIPDKKPTPPEREEPARARGKGRSRGRPRTSNSGDRIRDANVRPGNISDSQRGSLDADGLKTRKPKPDDLEDRPQKEIANSIKLLSPLSKTDKKLNDKVEREVGNLEKEILERKAGREGSSNTMKSTLDRLFGSPDKKEKSNSSADRQKLYDKLRKVPDKLKSAESLDKIDKVFKSMDKRVKAPKIEKFNKNEKLFDKIAKIPNKANEIISKPFIKTLHDTLILKSPEKISKSEKTKFVEISKFEKELKSPEKVSKSPEKVSKSPEKISKSPEKVSKSPEKLSKSVEKPKSPEKILKFPEKVKSLDKAPKPIEKVLKTHEKVLKSPEKVPTSPVLKSPVHKSPVPKSPEEHKRPICKSPEKVLKSPEKILKSPEKVLRSPERVIKPHETVDKFEKSKSPERLANSPVKEMFVDVKSKSIEEIYYNKLPINKIAEVEHIDDKKHKNYYLGDMLLDQVHAEAKIECADDRKLKAALQNRSIFSPQPHVKESDLLDEFDNILSISKEVDALKCAFLAAAPFKEDTKEDNARETLNLVEKLRMELSKKTTGYDIEDSVSVESNMKNDNERLEFNEQIVPNNVVESSRKDDPINDQEKVQDCGYRLSCDVTVSLSNNVAPVQHVNHTAAADERWVPPSEYANIGVDQKHYPEHGEVVQPYLQNYDGDRLGHTSPQMDLPPQIDVSILPQHIDAELQKNQSPNVRDRRITHTPFLDPASMDCIPSPSPYADIHPEAKWADSQVMPNRRSSSSSAASTSSTSSRRNDAEDDKLMRSDMIMMNHPPEMPFCVIQQPIPPFPPNTIEGFPPYSEASQFVSAVSLFPPPSINSQMSFSSPGPALFPPPFGAPFPAPHSIMNPMPKPVVDAVHFSSPCTAAFTTSRDNMALTAAMVNPPPVVIKDPVPEEELVPTAVQTTITPVEEIPASPALSNSTPTSNHVQPSPNPSVKSNSSAGKKSPSKPTRTSARFLSQQSKSPSKSPGKSPRQEVALKAIGSRGRADAKRLSGKSGRGVQVQRARGRGRGRGRGGVQHSDYDFTNNTIHNKLIGTVYDLDFDEDIPSESMGDLRAMRERRKSVDVHDRRESLHISRDSSQSPKFASPSQTHKNRYNADLKDLRPPTPITEVPAKNDLQTSALSDCEVRQSFPDIVQPVLPGPVDMRTYNSSCDSQTYTELNLLTAFSTEAPKRPVHEDIDEDFEKELHSALTEDYKIPDDLPAPEVSNIKVSLSDSRNQLKVKIKGPIANYTSTVHTPLPSATADAIANITPNSVSSSMTSVSINPGTSNLRRMRKKELLRQYWTQDMNMDDPTAIAATPTVPPINRTIITIPKAVASMTSIPTKDDYRDYRTGVEEIVESKLRKESKSRPGGMSRELRQLDIPIDEDLERRRSLCASASNTFSSSFDSNKRRGRPPRPMQTTPKLKIRISGNSIVGGNKVDDKRDAIRPPKKRLPSIPRPSVEDLKRESMKFRKQVMAEFVKKKDKGGKKKKKKKHNVQIISNESTNPTKLIIRFGKKSDVQVKRTSDGACGVSDEKTGKTEQFKDRDAVTLRRCPEDATNVDQLTAGCTPTLRLVRTNKVSPIKLKLSRCQEGSGYVMKSNATVSGDDNCGSAPPSLNIAEPVHPLPLNKDCEVR